MGARLLVLALVLSALGCRGADRVASQPPAPRLFPGDTADKPPLVDTLPRVEVLLGATHPPWPAGVEPLAGALAPRPGRLYGQPEYGFDRVRVGPAQLLVLSRVVSLRTEGNTTTPSWRIVDLVLLPQPEPGKRVILWGCRIGPDSSVAVIADRVTPAIPGRVYQAWRVDWPRERLIPVAADSVVCDRR